jgi:hypothetical protein
MGRVLPVAKAGQVSVGAGLACVLGRRLSVHLQHAATRSPDHPAEQVHVVDLAGGRGCLVGLVDALEHGGEKRLCFAQDPGCGADVGRRHAADLRRSLGRILAHDLLELLVADRALCDPGVIDTVVRDELMEERVEKSEVRTVADGEVNIGMARRNGRAGIDDHKPGRVRPREPVEHSHPEDGLGLGHVVPDVKDRVARFDVRVRGRLAVAAEDLLESVRASPC